jgi:beta-fructofuranosidase
MSTPTCLSRRNVDADILVDFAAVCGQAGRKQSHPGIRIMPSTTVSLASGTRIEFWARALTEAPVLTFHIGETPVFQTPLMARHWDYFTYHHRESCEAAIAWDPTSVEVAFAYAYDPKTVNDTGIELWEFSASGLNRWSGQRIDELLRADPARPQLHFSPLLNWMNDPVGLCKLGDTWHLFYQFHPVGTDWGPMHWGHATSKNLLHWTHLPVFLHPAQNLWRMGATGGAFSGNAFIDRNGDPCFYYTERLPAYDLFQGYREVQKIARADKSLLKANSVSPLIEDRPAGVAHDFRDPKVWWDAAAEAYRMVLGASIDGDPAVLLYGSSDGLNWNYLRPLYRAAPHFKAQGARAVECPDFFSLDGKWVLIMGFVGYTEPETGRHNLLFALSGDFVGDVFTPQSRDLQTLDFGTDFYAMQSFNADGRQIAFAWLFNWEDRKPAGSPYSGELSLPRELHLDTQNRLCLRAADEFGDSIFGTALASDGSGDIKLRDAPFSIRLDGKLDQARITATQIGALCFEVTIEQGIVSVRLPQDDGSISYSAVIGEATDLRLVHDCGIVEIFIDGGAICGTRRSYTNASPDRLAILTIASVSVRERSDCGVGV